MHHEDQRIGGKFALSRQLAQNPAGAGASIVCKSLPSRVSPPIPVPEQEFRLQEREEFPPNCFLWLNPYTEVVPLNPAGYRECDISSRLTICCSRGIGEIFAESATPLTEPTIFFSYSAVVLWGEKLGLHILS